MTTAKTDDTQEIATVPIEGELIMSDDARLFDSQQRRSIAVSDAAIALTSVSNGRVDATEVLALAAWIIDGGDPFARKSGEV